MAETYIHVKYITQLLTTPKKVKLLIGVQYICTFKSHVVSTKIANTPRLCNYQVGYMKLAGY